MSLLKSNSNSLINLFTSVESYYLISRFLNKAIDLKSLGPNKSNYAESKCMNQRALIKDLIVLTLGVRSTSKELFMCVCVSNKENEDQGKRQKNMNFQTLRDKRHYI